MDRYSIVQHWWITMMLPLLETRKTHGRWKLTLGDFPLSSLLPQPHPSFPTHTHTQTSSSDALAYTFQGFLGYLIKLLSYTTSISLTINIDLLPHSTFAIDHYPSNISLLSLLLSV
jgi:hypothetical protein